MIIDFDTQRSHFDSAVKMPNAWQITVKPWGNYTMNNHDHFLPNVSSLSCQQNKIWAWKNTEKTTTSAGGCPGDRTGLRDSNHDGFDRELLNSLYSVLRMLHRISESCAWTRLNQHKFTSFLVIMESVRANQFVPTAAMPFVPMAAMLCRLSEKSGYYAIQLTKS